MPLTVSWSFFFFSVDIDSRACHTWTTPFETLITAVSAIQEKRKRWGAFCFLPSSTQHQGKRSSASFICEQKRSFASRISDGNIYLHFLRIHFRFYFFAFHSALCWRFVSSGEEPRLFKSASSVQILWSLFRINLAAESVDVQLTWTRWLNFRDQSTQQQLQTRR